MSGRGDGDRDTGRSILHRLDTARERAVRHGGWALSRLNAAAHFYGARARADLQHVGLPLRSPASVVYHPDYVIEVRDAGARHAFDVRRSAKILERLFMVGILGPANVVQPVAASREDLLAVHPAEYLDEIRRPDKLAKLLFLPEEILRDGALFNSFLLQTGGTVLATERAVLERTAVFNLGGGFHHAQRDRAEGFCAINDVAVAIKRLQRSGLVERVLVVDLDYHPGNGTALIFSRDEGVFTLSVHGQSWARVEGKHNNLDVELPPHTGDAQYLQAVKGALRKTLRRFTPQLAIYLAGTDPFQEDTLGDFEISEEGMLARDMFVWQTLRGAGIPLAVVLAGGYSPLSWALTYNFVFSALVGRPIDDAHRPSNIAAHYRRVKARLSPAELRGGDSTMPGSATATVCKGGRLERRFMGYYTPDGVRLVLERYGLLDLLRDKGFFNLHICISTQTPERQMVRIYFDGIEDPDHLLIELVTRFRELVTPLPAVEQGIAESFRMVSIEWLLMQNPRATFSLDRQRLPGQAYPGLGIGRWMVELLRMMVERLGAAGLMNIPRHYHNAYLYSKQMLCFYPDDQGYLEAIKRDLGHLPLVETSLAIDEGRLRDADSGAPIAWDGRPQVMPVEAGLNAYFTRPAYIRAVARARERFHFTVAPPR